MDRYEYMQLPFGITPQDIIGKYNPTDIKNNGKFYINIQKGMHGLPQDKIIAHDGLKKPWRSTYINL